MRTAALVCLILGAPITAAQAVTDADRVKVYREFRELFDAKNFAAALPAAERLVQLSEQQYGPDDRQLANPLANVATTQLKLANYPAAEAAYLRSIRILETSAAAADRQLIRPLHGLGATYLAASQAPNAIAPLKRALDLTRNLDGLFNASQLELIFPLIDAYVAAGRLQDAEKEHGYAFRVAETTYGRSDIRLIDSLERYARWYELVGRYSTARVIHDRALGIVERSGVANDVRSVPALRGIARTYRLEFLYGAETSESGSQPTDAFGNPLPSIEGSQAGQLQRRGEQALRLALAVLDKNQPVNYRLRGETAVELGDWFMTGGATAKGIEAYREAWQSLVTSGDTTLMQVPRQLAYRGSTFSVGRTRVDPEQATQKGVETRFTVTADGRVTDVVSTTQDVSEPIVRSVVNAVKRARYAPRFENGEPVETRDVVYVDQVLVRNPALAPSS
jgi:hypothetical protein